MGYLHSREISWEQVKLHGYIVANSKVYDLPRFITEHAGDGHHPIETLLNLAGTDCTEHFKMHGSRARDKWKQYYLGRC